MKQSKLLLSLAFVLFLQPSLRCGEWVIKHTAYYITAKEESFHGFPPPPAAGSPEERADMTAMRDWELKRSTQQCQGALSEKYATYDEFFGDISPFPRPLPPAAAAILGRIRDDADTAADITKKRFARERPFRKDQSLDPCLGRVGGLSYPSGHATISRLYALVLSDVRPSMRGEFLARADQAALYRVIGGVHYPSDVEAGKKLADMLYSAFRKSHAFRRDLETLRRLVKKGAPVEPAKK